MSIKNKEFLESSKLRLYKKFQQKKLWKLESQNREGNINHFYDDDIVESVAEEFLDRISVAHLIGDIFRWAGGLLGIRPTLTPEQMHLQVLDKILHDKKISRKDIACFTDILPEKGNSMIPFMNGGPMGEHWNISPNGLYDWIDNKSSQSIIGIELGFKGDEYGLEVSRRLIAKKQNNPDMYVGLLIDGFVSVFIQDPDVIDDFQNKTLEMIKQMKSVGIDVRINDSWNPLSSDFLAANHIKLWIFDGKAAFVGGIGIESQFIKTLYDQMDLIQGPFVRTLTLMSFLLMVNQRRNLVDQGDNITQIYEMNEKTLGEKFLPDINNSGELSMEISVNVPGYVQDAQGDYCDLLLRDDVSEIFIMTPYFSDDKIARALVAAANKLEKKYYNVFKNKIKNENPNITDDDLEEKTTTYLEEHKKIHVIFPKKQENAIIEEVSKYYAYYMRKNSIVETKQFVVNDGNISHEMLHAKQMVVLLENDGKKKYIKFGGSYNPAGRAHNMWEINNITYLKNINDDDTGLENPVKDYLDKVFWKIIKDYSEPFRWGQKDVKLNVFELFVMKFAQILFF